MTKRTHYKPMLWLVVIAVLVCCCDAWITYPQPIASTPCRYTIRKNATPIGKRQSRTFMIGTGFTFEDGEQVLVSVQKPFGLVLEQGSDGDEEDDRIIVTEVDPNGSASKAGVREGDVLVAVQNASTISADLEQVLEFISTKCPRVVNLRFQRVK